MNRRELIKIFGAATVAALVPETVQQILAPPRVMTWRLVELSAFGTAKQPQAATAGVRRGSSDLLTFYLNAFGGSVVWSAPPGREIWVPAGEPMLLAWTSDHRVVSVYGLMLGENNTLGILTQEGLQCLEGIPA